MEKFQVLLNCVDHYQAAPTSFDPQLPVNAGPVPKNARPKVPVIRVFGTTETGQKVCAHVHGAFPYLYIEYQGSLNPKEVNTAIRTLQLSIDHALAISYRRNAYEKKMAYVAHITFVKGIPFYGYHVGYRFFFKIYLFNPMNMTRLADLLRQGAVMKRVLQPYESHLQYLSQWMCDYNLYGCAYLKSSKVTFRAPIPTYLENSTHIWHDRSIPESAVLDNSILPRQSHCDLEVDIHVQDIINRSEVKERPIHQDFVEMLQPLEPDRSLTKMQAVVDEEHLGRKPTYTDFVATTSFEATIRSALSSVEDLFPGNIQVMEPEDFGIDKMAEESRAHVDVDESLIVTPRQEGFSYDSDDDDDDDDDVNDSFLHEQEVEIAGDLEPKSADDLTISSSLSNQDCSKGSKETEAEDQVDLLDLKRFGVRPSNDFINSQDDVFKIDEEFISDIDSRLNGLKRANSTLRETDVENKRLKLGNDGKIPPITNATCHDRLNSATTQNLPVGESTELESATVNFPSSSQLKQSQKLSRSTNGNKRISFHVVKDPHDPATISRLSQQDISSLKSQSQGSKQVASLSVSALEPAVSNRTFDDSSKLNQSETHSSSVLEPQHNLYESFNIPPECRIFSFIPACPSRSEVLTTMQADGRPSIIYQGPHYSNEEDVPDRAREYAGREFKLESTTVPYLPLFDLTGYSPALFGDKPSIIINRDAFEKENNKLRKSCSLRTWEFAPTAPSRSEVVEWLEEDIRKLKDAKGNNIPSQKPASSALSQIEGPTQKNRHGFKYSQKKPARNVRQEAQYMSVMSLEVHVNTRGTLVPNPEEDEISCVFWCVQDGETEINDDDDSAGITAGIIALSENESLAARISPTMVSEFEEEHTELDLLTRLVDVVRQRDPDILTGYEVHNSSWGYLIERARYKYDYDLCDEFKRPRDIAKVINYFLSRVQLDLKIIESNELISRTSEQARILGIDFFSVFSRGSQFKVESLMFRIAKPENFILISPGKKQVGQQNALECLPLVMEPQSDFYTSPLLVLDFQSLYPSIMIAYNYCYSTCLGRVVSWRGQNKLGFIDFRRPAGLLELLKDQINIAPNGIIYAKQEVRKSLLAKMLIEILETRVMVKGGMKADKDDKHLQRLLNNRQLALKLIANVTYGYTSASFSGRMPCAEIADSIVQTARETLEKAIVLIHSVERWGAEVVYGDTDSIFVYLKGRTRDEAFDIGEEIARAVTDSNPRPVKLKFEKVYHPCVLLAKKRYVGYKRMLEDPRTEVQYGERVPYVVISGAPGARLIDRCVAPEVLLHDSQLELDAEYYISKNLIPPLERIFNLVGANVRQWYDEMPKYQRVRRIEGGASNVPANKEGLFSAKKTLESYMKLSSCVVCREKLEGGEEQICTGCLRDSHVSLLQLKSRLMKEERKEFFLHKICRSCMGVSWGEEVKCDSKDCPVFYTRTRQGSQLRSTRAAVEPVIKACVRTAYNSFQPEAYHNLGDMTKTGQTAMQNMDQSRSSEFLR
ncbi:polymerase zeta subunit [Histoplasma capsulatum H143]|uniref:DNA polymerase n=1 Tax=Ajellomyces capsulatus (strain H143) TaxID=544712 RepID=C6HLR0_AJECH|nr:polymerase zeta subunit [Histoplasma capsulatum H143]